MQIIIQHVYNVMSKQHWGEWVWEHSSSSPVLRITARTIFSYENFPVGRRYLITNQNFSHVNARVMKQTERDGIVVKSCRHKFGRTRNVQNTSYQLMTLLVKLALIRPALTIRISVIVQTTKYICDVKFVDNWLS